VSHCEPLLRAQAVTAVGRRGAFEEVRAAWRSAVLNPSTTCEYGDAVRRPPEPRPDPSQQGAPGRRSRRHRPPLLKPFPGEPLIATQMVCHADVGLGAGEPGQTPDLSRHSFGEQRNLEQAPWLSGAAVQGV
jgi:hypothetical protein